MDSPTLPEIGNAVSETGNHLKTGLLITFEGGEGTGKTTQSTRLANRMIALGIDVLSAREPGATRLGEQIRTWVKRESDTSVIAETLLFAAARAQLVNDLLRPSIDRGSVVTLDRFIDSTIAYQGYGRGMNVATIRAINEIASGGLIPDLTVFLDSDPKTALSRVGTAPSLFDKPKASKSKLRMDREDEMHFENQPISFHRKVRAGYQELAKEGGRWCVIKADQAQHRIADAIWKRVRPLLIERGVDPELLVRKQGEAAE